MVDVLNDFIPPAALDQVATLLSHDSLVVKIKQERKTRPLFQSEKFPIQNALLL